MDRIVKTETLPLSQDDSTECVVLYIQTWSDDRTPHEHWTTQQLVLTGHSNQATFDLYTHQLTPASLRAAADQLERLNGQ